MSSHDTFLLVMGGTLTVLALVSGFFIVNEIVLFIRELTGRGRTRPVWQVRAALRRPGDTGPLEHHAEEPISLRAERVAPEPIQPLRDAEVVRQLINHLKENGNSSEDG